MNPKNFITHPYFLPTGPIVATRAHASSTKNTRLRQDLPLARQRNGERNSKTLYKYFTETNNMFVYKP